MSAADRQQARYFDELLGCHRAKLDQRIDGLSVQVSKMDRIGDDARLRHSMLQLQTSHQQLDATPQPAPNFSSEAAPANPSLITRLHGAASLLV
jgi:hypothetical protein